MSETSSQLKSEFNLGEARYDPEERQAWATFTTFQRNVQNLDHELQDLIASVIPLGASVAVLWSSWRMREQLAATLSVIDDAAKQRCPSIFNFPGVKLDPDALRMILPFNVALPTYLSTKEVHTELLNLAKHIDAFFGCLQEFTGYVDGSITDAVVLIQADLSYIAQRVEEAKEQSKNVGLASEVFIHDITPDIGSRLVRLTKAISSVKRGSLMSLKFTHEHAVSNFTSMATIATFLSAVIATVLALPHNPHSSFSDALTSGCWLISLVLSISSAFHSVWAASWQQAVYRFPNARVPPFVRSWMLHAPICLLLSSVAVFCAGLVFFAISSQPRWVIVAVTVVLGSCTLGFTVCAAWFLLEFAAYFRYKGEFHNDMWSFLGLKWGNGPRPHLAVDGLGVPLPTTEIDPQSLPRIPSHESTARKRFIRIVEFIIRIRRHDIGQQRAPSGDPIPIPRNPRLWSTDSTPNLLADPRARLAHAVKVVANTTAQYPPVMTVGFSPDGRCLASSSIDGNARVFAMPRLAIMDLTSPRKVFGQPLWSPDGSRLAVRKGPNILLYFPERDASPRLISRRPEVTVVRPSPVKYISWSSNNQAFLSLEDSGAVKISSSGEQLGSYQIEDVVLRAAGVLHGGNIIFLGAATKDRMPSTACAQNYIIVYHQDPSQHRLLIKIPIAHKAIDLSLSDDRRWVLVSYEDRIPPQLFHWHFDPELRTNRLTRKRTFVPTHDEPFAGRCVMSGKKDEFVLGATRSGNIYIWDRGGTLLRLIEAERDSPGISCISGSHSHDGCTFATGSLDGTVRFWQGLDTDTRTDQTIPVPLPRLAEELGLTGEEAMSPTLIAGSSSQELSDERSVGALGLSVS